MAPCHLDGDQAAERVGADDGWLARHPDLNSGARHHIGVRLGP